MSSFSLDLPCYQSLSIESILSSLEVSSKTILKKLLPKKLKFTTTHEVPSEIFESPLKDNKYISLRKKFDSFVSGEVINKPIFETPFISASPFATTTTYLFLLGLSGEAEDEVLRAFAYIAVADAISHTCSKVCILQKEIWSYNHAEWKDKKKFFDMFSYFSKKQQVEEKEIISIGNALMKKCNIGYHTKKEKTLPQTILSLKNVSRPYQIFLGNPQSSTLSVSDAEITLTSAAMSKKDAKMYVHSQYIINLCQEGSYHTKLLEKNLFYASNAGFKGVVVHVGKSTIQEKETAISIMRTNLEQALSAATPECPILLETPAGQGTETLTDMIEFIDFVASFQDNRIRICVDTCHVFASGTNPYKYISTVQERDPTLLKLVHFNDSCTPCGSCVDRHAFVGTGYIGMEDMYKVGTFCDTLHIPMVVE